MARAMLLMMVMMFLLMMSGYDDDDDHDDNVDTAKHVFAIHVFKATALPHVVP